MDGNTPLLTTTGTSRKKFRKAIAELNSALKQLDLRGNCGMFHQTTAEYTLFSSLYGKFTKIEHVLAHETHLNQSEAREIIQNIPSEHKSINLEISNRKILKTPQILED